MSVEPRHGGKGKNEARGRPWLDVSTGRLVALLLIALLLAIHSLYLTASSIPIDDAYIVFRYAKHLAAGDGLTFNPGERVEGYTCFSWVLLGAVFERLGFSSAKFLPRVGLLASIATLAVVAHACRKLRAQSGAAPSPFSGVAAALFLALSPSFAFYAGTGLETPLYLLLVTTSIVFALLNEPRLVALSAVLALLTRPEGAFVGALALGIGLLRSPSEGRRAWVSAGLYVAAAVACYAAFKWWYFGALLPNTFAAKPPALGKSVSYVRDALFDTELLILVGVVLAFVGRKRSPANMWVAGVYAVFASIALAEGPDWMKLGRFLLPATCVGAILVDGIFVRSIPAGGSLLSRYWPFVLATPGIGIFVVLSARVTPLVAESSVVTEAAGPIRDAFIRRLVDEHVRSVGTLDVGRMAYVAMGVRFLDLGGLTDRAIGHAPGNYMSKEPSLETLELEAPDGFLFTSEEPPVTRGDDISVPTLSYPVEDYVRKLPWFSRHYRFAETITVRENYFLHWYTRAAGPTAGSVP
jgi:arabinofuranosyltransferase